MRPGSSKKQACLGPDSVAIPEICAIEVPLHYDPADEILPGDLDFLAVKVVDAAHACYENDEHSEWEIFSSTNFLTSIEVLLRMTTVARWKTT